MLATSVGHIPELLDAECGVLVPTEAPELLAEALRTLAYDGALRARLAAAAAERVRTRGLTLDGSVGQLLEVYSRTSASPPVRGRRALAALLVVGWLALSLWQAVRVRVGRVRAPRRGGCRPVGRTS